MKGKDSIGWILMAAALMVGALAFYMVKNYLAEQESKLRAQVESERGEMRKIVVANSDLLTGSVISAATMSIGEIPARHVSDRMVTPDHYKALEGRVLNRSMSSGEPLLMDFIAGVVIERFSDLLSEGERAISLEVSPLETHAGMLVPGDYIDLFVLIGDSAATSHQRLMPLLERVKILAAGPEPLRAADQSYQPLPAEEAQYSQITIAALAADTERITLAQGSGTIKYLLRNAGDPSMLALESGRTFFGDAEPSDGYFYFSNSLPMGEQRINGIGEAIHSEQDGIHDD